MKNTILTLLVLASLHSQAQHTFSIVAVDTITGEIGSAGATCGDSIIWPGTPGAYIISDVIPGVGAIHTQAYYLEQNQANASFRMKNGMSSEDVLDYLINNDVQNNPSRRQYGLIDYNGGQPRAVAYTGDSADDYKDHKTGDTYAIQGNILLGPEILDSMEARFNRGEGCLSDRLMSAMQGANVAGADTRCLGQGVSSLSAFLRVAKPDDLANDLTLDINIAGTDFGVEPIDILQGKYDAWKVSNENDCSLTKVEDTVAERLSFKIIPNPSLESITIILPNSEIDEIILTDVLGNKIEREIVLQGQSQLIVDVSFFDRGIYFVTLLKNQAILISESFLKQ